MAVYKVPQDVEAEDKFLGPLSFKQFLFFGGTAVCGYLTFMLLTKGMWYFSFLFGLPTIAFGILAFPWSKEQPSELWLAAHIRFYFIRRKRIWDQSGMKDLVTITAPKHEVHALTDGLSPDEVKTRFNALASVIDSRGWAVKNTSNSDRLVTLDNSAPTVTENIVTEATDIMDETSNPLAKQFDSMIEDSKSKHRQDTLSMIEEARQLSEGGAVLSMALPSPTVSQSSAPTNIVENQNPLGVIEEARKTSEKNPAPADDFWFLNQQPSAPPAGFATFQNQTVVAPGQNPVAPPPTATLPTANHIAISEEDEQKLLQKVHTHQQQEAMIQQQSHTRTLQPLSEQLTPSAGTTNPPINSSATPVDPAILSLSGNDDLNVETIARQANKGKLDDNEVVIQLR